MFAQSDHLDPDGRYLNWPEVSHLKELADEIRGIRLEIGDRNEICERFASLCSRRGPNVPGEPKLAAEFLVEVDQER